MKKMFVNNLPSETSEADVSKLFSEFGTVRSVHLATDVFTRKCRGFGFVEMEGHEARAAISGLDGQMLRGNSLRVNLERPRTNGRRR